MTPRRYSLPVQGGLSHAAVAGKRRTSMLTTLLTVNAGALVFISGAPQAVSVSPDTSCNGQGDVTAWASSRVVSVGFASSLSGDRRHRWEHELLGGRRGNPSTVLMGSPGDRDGCVVGRFHRDAEETPAEYAVGFDGGALKESAGPDVDRQPDSEAFRGLA